MFTKNRSGLLVLFSSFTLVFLSSLVLGLSSPFSAQGGQDRPENHLNFGIASGWAGTEIELPLELELVTETRIGGVEGELRWQSDQLKFLRMRPSYLIELQGGEVEAQVELEDVPGEEGSAVLRFKISGGEKGLTEGRWLMFILRWAKMSEQALSRLIARESFSLFNQRRKLKCRFTEER